MRLEIDVLIEANPYMTDLILKNNKYPEININPLNDKELLNEWYGAPVQFRQIYLDIYDQILQGNYAI